VDLSQVTIRDRKVASVRVVGVALFMQFEEVEVETYPWSFCRRCS
jgi:hypothetical protein